jgi:hypothetical protein
LGCHNHPASPPNEHLGSLKHEARFRATIFFVLVRFLSKIVEIGDFGAIPTIMLPIRRRLQHITGAKANISHACDG